MTQSSHHDLEALPSHIFVIERVDVVQSRVRNEFCKKLLVNDVSYVDHIRLLITVLCPFVLVLLQGVRKETGSQSDHPFAPGCSHEVH